MKKPGKIVVCMMLCAALVTGLCGCATYTNFKNAFFGGDVEAQEKTIKIGVYEPMSGKYKDAGKEEIDGIELAHDLYPTVLGKKVELVYADNHSDMYAADTAIQELISSGSPSVILGSYGETLTMVAGEYVRASATPNITISCTNPLLTSTNEYCFSATYTETRQGDALADFAYKDRDRKKVATLKIDGDDTATATIKRFTNRIKKLTNTSGSVGGNFSVTNEETDYSNIIEVIRSTGADTVFLAVAPKTARAFMEQAIKNNLTHVLFLGTRDWNDEKLLKFVKSNPTLKVAFPTEESQTKTSTMSEVFMGAYKEKFGEYAEPSEKTAVAFDAYCLAIKAITEAYKTVEATDPDEMKIDSTSEAEIRAIKEALEKAKESGVPQGMHIKNALNSINGYEGASGTISYNGNNEATKTISINYYIGGKLQPAFSYE